MPNPNKVEFGISNLHVWEYNEASDGTVTFGTPYHQKGAIGFSPEQDDNSNTRYADNIAYWSNMSNGPFEGDLEVVLFDDDFKERFLGYVRLTSGGLAQVKNPAKKKVCIAFDIEGDVQTRRAVFYNCSLGAIGRGYATLEEEVETATETLPINCIGDNESGATMEVLKPGDTGYDDLYTSPMVPELTDTSE
ncbi:hypothetical protein IJI72_02735 [Candidatus Saccharibacteria bacterium]|nr:hypothetical protein [Candidatus Saccharibacteria bacterium]